jgi:hypothetical protein
MGLASCGSTAELFTTGFFVAHVYILYSIWCEVLEIGYAPDTLQLHIYLYLNDWTSYEYFFNEK